MSNIEENVITKLKSYGLHSVNQIKDFDVSFYQAWLGGDYQEDKVKAEQFDLVVREFLGYKTYTTFNDLARLDAKLLYTLGLGPAVVGGIDLANYADFEIVSINQSDRKLQEVITKAISDELDRRQLGRKSFLPTSRELLKTIKIGQGWIDVKSIDVYLATQHLTELSSLLYALYNKEVMLCTVKEARLTGMDLQELYEGELTDDTLLIVMS